MQQLYIVTNIRQSALINEAEITESEHTM